MSYTEIFSFNKKGEAEGLADIPNAFRSAMAVWIALEKKYLPKYTPLWAEEGSGEYSRMSDFTNRSGMAEIWNLMNDDNVTRAEKIALGTTLDNVVVFRENFEELVSAFREFEHDTSLKEQADVIETSLKDENVIAVGWNQTSVNGDTWLDKGGYTDEDEPIPYNILSMDEHWNLFEELEEKVNEENTSESV